MVAILSRVGTLALPRWGNTVALGSVNKGWSAGNGSGEVTSRPA
jgi:hypothetical protein